MRVIAGKYKSRIIEMPKGTKTRPVQDKIKGAIFNILGSLCIDAKVLDLFSGSGSFGIEALSRGAKEATFVDNNSTCVETIKKNLKSLGITYHIHILKLDAFRAVKKFARDKKTFDLIFVDPPYYSDMVEKTLMAIGKYDIMSLSGVAVARHFKKDEIPQSVGSLQLIRQSVYGGNFVSFYKVTQKSNFIF